MFYPRYYITNFNLRYGFNDRVNYKRAGVLPYFVEDNELYFILSIDTHTKQYSDFGGKKNRDDTHWCITAKRELFEESCSILDLHVDDLKRSINVTDEFNVYCFPNLEKMNLNKFELTKNYYLKLRKRMILENISSHFFETEDLYIMKYNEFKTELEKDNSKCKIWPYIKDFFSSGKNLPTKDELILNKTIKKNFIGEGLKKIDIIEYEEDTDEEWEFSD